MWWEGSSLSKLLVRRGATGAFRGASAQLCYSDLAVPLGAVLGLCAVMAFGGGQLQCCVGDPLEGSQKFLTEALAKKGIIEMELYLFSVQ